MRQSNVLREIEKRPRLLPKTILLLVNGTPGEAANMAKAYEVDAELVERRVMTNRTVMVAPLHQYENIVKWWKSGTLVKTLMETEE